MSLKNVILPNAVYTTTTTVQSSTLSFTTMKQAQHAELHGKPPATNKRTFDTLDV